MLLTTARHHYRRYLGARLPELAGHPLNYVLQLLASQLMLHLCRFVQVQNIGRRGWIHYLLLFSGMCCIWSWQNILSFRLNESLYIGLALVKYGLNLQDLSVVALLPDKEVLDLLQLLLRMFIVVHVAG